MAPKTGKNQADKTPAAKTSGKTRSPKKLTGAHGRALGTESASHTLPLPLAPIDDHPAHERTRAYFERYEALRAVPMPVIRRAWFTMAHLILSPGAIVADMGCGDGEMTFAMAVLNPDLKFIGVDSDKKTIARARQKFTLPNLEFITGDISGGCGLEEGALDAVINSFTLHDVYSESKYHDRYVVATLEYHITLLKPDGQLFVQDYPMPAQGEYILIEMPDRPARGSDLQSMSEPDLLVWYSEHARPKQDAGGYGFFIEELPPRFPRTRLFRLPHKWAYEFITRKDDRARMERDLPREYTFFTQGDFRKSLRAAGMRVLYSAPHWDDAEIKRKFEGRFRLYADDGTPMGPPATSFIALAQKVGDRKSVEVMERRPAARRNSAIKISAMRNERSGKLVDVVSREVAVMEIMPYRLSPEGRLSVFIHEGAPRGIVNAVPRSGKNLDEKRWSGHMIEAISVDKEAVDAVATDDLKAVVHFARDQLGMRPAIGALLERGPGFYPAPEYIDEHIGTRYLRIEDGQDSAPLKKIGDDLSGFSAAGRMREVDAQALLDAISVGYIPNPRLETQLIVLFGKLGLKAETWNDSPMTLRYHEPEELFDGKKFAGLLSHDDRRYKATRGTAGLFRTMQSIFVDEGWVDGGITGLNARDMEFVISDENTVNKAVVIPLTRNAKGTVMVGVMTEFLPVPQRFQGNGLTLRAPSFDLPKDITNIHQARKFVAEQFGVKLENVFRLGESYYTHIGLTPQRIFPFAVSASKMSMKTLGGPCQFAPLGYIWTIIDKVLSWDCDEVFLSAVAKITRRMSYQNEMSLSYDRGHKNWYGPYESAAPDVLQDMTGLYGIGSDASASVSAGGDGGENGGSFFSDTDMIAPTFDSLADTAPANTRARPEPKLHDKKLHMK